MPLRSAAPRLGIALMLGGMLLFALNDTMGKWLVATYTVGSVLLIRSGAALVVLAPALWRAGPALWRVERPGMQAARVAFSTLEVYCFYYAVTWLPLADVMTFWLAAPIYVAALSQVMLGERVGPWRWAAIVAGFAGVAIALQPGLAAGGPAVAVSLVGSFAFAFMILSGRLLRGTPDTVLVFWQMAGAGLAGLATAPFGWVQPSALDFALLAALGVVAVLAHLCVNRALKLGDAAGLAPLQYTLLVWAIILGWLFFGDLPSPALLAGAAVIVASGLLIWLREARARRSLA